MYSVLVQENGSILISFFLFNLIMDTTVNFYTQTKFWTVEIQYIGAKAMLLPKTITIQLLSSKIMP
jgi:hypothetical protein